MRRNWGQGEARGHCLYYSGNKRSCMYIHTLYIYIAHAAYKVGQNGPRLKTPVHDTARSLVVMTIMIITCAT